MRIKNIVAAPHYSCTCGSWLRHWEKFGNKKSPLCAAVDCKMPAVLGTHVQRAEAEDDIVYVVPLCEVHSENKEEMEISDEYKLVSADKNLTCERW